ncbi:MAG TPA: hypothetical protein VI454_01980, partial [Verrucomicrobiae bacterium]
NGAGLVRWPQSGIPLNTNLVAVTNIGARTWPGLAESKFPQLLLPYTFQIPIKTNFVFLGTNTASYVWSNAGQTFRPLAPLGYTNQIGNTIIPGTEQYELGQGFYVPDWHVVITNRLRFFMIDTPTNPAYPSRIVDFVNLTNSHNIDILTNLAGNMNLFSGTTTNAGQARYWLTNRVAGPSSATQGVIEQIATSSSTGSNGWAGPATGQSSPTNQARIFVQFINNATNSPFLTMQTPFNPTYRFYVNTLLEANDPLVHYLVSDLMNPIQTNQVTTTPQIGSLGQLNTRYQPWGGNRRPGNSPLNPVGSAPWPEYDIRIKDPNVRWSDEWDFPTNKLGSVGWIGRVHRGTPWQTIYLKAAVIETNDWYKWAGHYLTDPTNDWALADLFTVALDDNAQRGLLSVNQTNIAAWSALLSGVPALSPTGAVDTAYSPAPLGLSNNFINAASPELSAIYTGIQTYRTNLPGQVFSNLAQFLGTPQLSGAPGVGGSPYVDTTIMDVGIPYTDAAYERLPQEILSLVTVEEAPRYAVYVWGQSLKPAPQSLVTGVGAGTNFGMCTNYQITGEIAAKALIRLERRYDTNAPGSNTFNTVIESFQILPNP